MNSLKSFWEVLRARLAGYGWKKIAAAALILIVAWFFFTRDEQVEVRTQAVERGLFIQEVSASGKVVAAQDVDLGFPQGGRISRVYVSAGSRVGAGTVLAEIENGDQRALVMQREAVLSVEEAKLKKVQAGTRGEELAIAESDVESAEAKLLQARRALRDAIGDAYRSADDAVRNTTDEFILNPRSSAPQFNAGEISLQYEIDVESQRLGMEQTLTTWSADLVALPAEGDLSIAVARAQTNLSKTVTYLSAVNAALNRAIPTGTTITQTVINGYIADVATARTAVNAAVTALTTAQTNERNAVNALTSAQRSLALKEAGSAVEDIEAQLAQVKVAQASLEDARAQLRKTMIVAPFAGIIATVDAKVGSSAAANTNAISMISNGTFQIESFIPEINIAFLQVGQRAVITLDAYGAETPFGAQVVSIDPAETVRDGVSTYRAVLQFDSADERIRSGMTANIVIKTAEKADVLAVPRGIVKERDGKKFVTVKTGEETTEEREVTTGDVASNGTIEILSGLTVGEHVVVSLQ